jgi:subfamily B ATP-binding cassette protein MsbA
MVTGMIMVALGTTASAYLIKPVLDKIFIQKNQSLLHILPFAIVAVYAVKGVGTFLQSYFSAYIGQDIVRRIRDRVLESILGMKMEFFHKNRSGELISRSINDIERVRSVVSNTLPIMAREILTIFALLGYIFYLNPKMALLSIIFIPLTSYPLGRLAKRMKKLSHSSQEKLSDLTSRLSEIFNNIEIIKANSTQKFELERFKEDNKKIFKINIKATKTTELVSPIMEIAGSLAIALVIIYGGSEVIENKITVGSFFSFLAALFMLYTPVKRVSKLYNSMQDAVAASERIFSLIESDENRQESRGGEEINFEINSISFEDVKLSYGDKEALRGITFDVKKGEKIALVGNSGGGKSSIANLILRLYEPTEGIIRFNGHNLNDLDIQSVRENISIVTQRVYIFNDTVAANVAYGYKMDKERVITSLKKANAWDFVQELPNGIDTKIDEFGTNLSGGQRQRIAIARAIYKDPKILIFDEATSALDNSSESIIVEALQEISKNKITFIIAHRLKTIEDADKIVVLKEGKVECIGKISELLKHCEQFLHLKGLQK